MLFPEIVVVGCGNPLFADDGFGPAVITAVRCCSFPDNVKIIDAGICGPEMVFSLLDHRTTRWVIVIDCMDFGGNPGTVVPVRLSDLPDDAIINGHHHGIAESLYSIDSTSEVIIIGCQPGYVSYPYMEEGLTFSVQMALPVAIEMLHLIIRFCENNTPGNGVLGTPYVSFSSVWLESSLLSRMYGALWFPCLKCESFLSYDGNRNVYFGSSGLSP